MATGPVARRFVRSASGRAGEVVIDAAVPFFPARTPDEGAVDTD